MIFFAAVDHDDCSSLRIDAIGDLTRPILGKVFAILQQDFWLNARSIFFD